MYLKEINFIVVKTLIQMDFFVRVQTIDILDVYG